MNRLTEAVKHLLIVNVLFFIATYLYGDLMYEWFSLWFPKNENFQFWQVGTHMFMHGGIAHIGFNMFALWMFGGPVEQYLGKNKFLFIYFSAGLGAALFQVGYYYFNYLPVYTELIDSGLAGDQISPSNTAYMAHVGGAVVGFIIMWYWKKNSFNKNRWD